MGLRFEVAIAFLMCSTIWNENDQSAGAGRSSLATTVPFTTPLYTMEMEAGA